MRTNFDIEIGNEIFEISTKSPTHLLLFGLIKRIKETNSLLKDIIYNQREIKSEINKLK